MTIHEFPVVKREEDKLWDYTKDLEKLYCALEETHRALNELELQATELEHMFEIDLQSYISKVGLRAVPSGILKYSGRMEDYIYETKDE
jgi:hypothetical protein